jgi:Ni/Co efflux regulator RcnB
MRFLLPDPLGNDKHSQMFHSSAFIIAGVGIGTAVAGSAISMSAADRAKKAQGAAAGTFKKQQRKAVQKYEQGQQQVQGMISEVKAPEYNLGAMIGDAGQITDYNIRQGRKISGYNLRQGQKISDYYRQQLETFQPGAAQQRQQAQTQIGQAMDVISQYLRGDIPQDVKDQITRNVAESAGAGFNPATAGRAGGFQAAQGQMARNLGLTSLDIQGRGLAAMPSVQGTAMNWQQLARAFTADVIAADVRASEPLDVGRLQLGYQGAAAEVGLQKAKMTSDMFSNIYNAQSGLATQIYGANKENIAASYAAQQAVGQGVSDIGKATSGALMGVSGAGSGMGGMVGIGGGGGGSSYNPYYGSLSNQPIYAGSQISQQYSSGNMASISDRPVALPKSQYPY